MNLFVIVNKNDLSLFWSNSEGWTEGDDFEVFTIEESESFDLPIEGEWKRLKVTA